MLAFIYSDFSSFAKKNVILTCECEYSIAVAVMHTGKKIIFSLYPSDIVVAVDYEKKEVDVKKISNSIVNHGKNEQLQG